MQIVQSETMTQPLLVIKKVIANGAYYIWNWKRRGQIIDKITEGKNSKMGDLFD